jgi:hypothetical protein
MSTLALVKAGRFNPRTKHLNLRYHHVGDRQRLGEVQLEYLKTDMMPADALTKPLARHPFVRHRQVLMGASKLAWAPISGLREVV